MAKQKLTQQIERFSESYECPKCVEPITNPICHSCLAKQIESWLSFYPDVKRKMLPKIRKYVKTINNLVIDATMCIACNKKKAALCPYCFSEAIFNLMKKSGVDKRILGDFAHLFNFDSDHLGYTKEVIEGGFTK